MTVMVLVIDEKLGCQLAEVHLETTHVGSVRPTRRPHAHRCANGGAWIVQMRNASATHLQPADLRQGNRLMRHLTTDANGDLVLYLPLNLMRSAEDRLVSSRSTQKKGTTVSTDEDTKDLAGTDSPPQPGGPRLGPSCPCCRARVLRHQCRGIQAGGERSERQHYPLPPSPSMTTVSTSSQGRTANLNRVGSSGPCKTSSTSRPWNPAGGERSERQHSPLPSYGPSPSMTTVSTSSQGRTANLNRVGSSCPCIAQSS